MDKQKQTLDPTIVTPVFVQVNQPKGCLYINLMAVASVFVPDDDGPCIITTHDGKTHHVAEHFGERLSALIENSNHLDYE